MARTRTNLDLLPVNDVMVIDTISDRHHTPRRISEYVEHAIKGKMLLRDEWMDLVPPPRLRNNTVLVGVTDQYKVKYFKVASRRNDKCACYPLKPDKKDAKILCTLKLKDSRGETGEPMYAFIVHPILKDSAPKRNSLSSKYLVIATDPTTRAMTVSYHGEEYTLHQYNSHMDYVSLVGSTSK